MLTRSSLMMTMDKFSPALLIAVLSGTAGCHLMPSTRSSSSTPTTTPASKESPRPKGADAKGGPCNREDWSSAATAGTKDPCWLLAADLDRANPESEETPPYYQALCTHGHASACYVLGLKTFSGSGIEQDVEKGIGIMEEACPKMPTARSDCFNFVGRYYEKEEHFSARVRELFDAACKARDGRKEACYDQGRACAGSLSLKGAEDLSGCFAKSCIEERSPKGCFEMGRLMVSAPAASAIQIHQGTSHLEFACGKGVAEACEQFEEVRMKGSQKARADLPKLFAQCAEQKSYIGRWRKAGKDAARSGDRKAAEQAQEKMQEIEPAWQRTNAAIMNAVSAEQEDPEKYRQLLQRVDRECNCKATPSGACG